jgi:hypothetical protein
MPGGARLELLVPGNVDDPFGLDAGDVPPEVVGAENGFISQPFQRSNFTQDTHVAAPIGEERGGGDHQYLDFFSQNGFPPE